MKVFDVFLNMSSWNILRTHSFLNTNLAQQVIQRPPPDGPFTQWRGDFFIVQPDPNGRRVVSRLRLRWAQTFNLGAWDVSQSFMGQLLVLKVPLALANDVGQHNWFASNNDALRDMVVEWIPFTLDSVGIYEFAHEGTINLDNNTALVCLLVLLVDPTHVDGQGNLVPFLDGLLRMTVTGAVQYRLPH